MEARSKNIKVRVTEKEYEELKKAAEDEGINVSGYIRRLIYQRDPELVWLDRLDRADQRLGEMIFQLRKVGVNINQIAHRINGTDMLLDSAVLEYLKKLSELSGRLEHVVYEGFKEVRDALRPGGEEGGNYKVDVSKTVSEKDGVSAS